MQRSGLLVFSLFLFSGVVCSQNGINYPYLAPKVYPLDNPVRSTDFRYPALLYNINTNLNTNDILSITEDGYGRIWFATRNSGFACIDGENLYSYGSHNRFFDRSWHLHADQLGRIWVGGNGIGAICLSGPYYSTAYQRSLASFPDSAASWYNISDVHIHGIICDSKNNVWVSTGLGGVTCIMADTSLFWTKESAGLPTNSIKSMTIDRHDRVWISAQKELFYIENYRIVKYELAPPEIEIVTLGYPKYGYVVGATPDGRLFKITPDAFEEMIIQFPDNRTRGFGEIAADRNGVMYLTDSRSVLKVVGQRATEILNSDHEIRSIFFDSNNSLWVGTANQGLIHVLDYSIQKISGWQATELGERFKILISGRYLIHLNIDADQILTFDTLHVAPAGETFDNIQLLTEGLTFRVGGKKTIYIGNDGKERPDLSAIYSKYTRTVALFEKHFLSDANGMMVYEKSAGNFVPVGMPFHRTTPIFADDEYVYFQRDVRDGYTNVVRWNETRTDSLITYLGGDSVMITGVHYINDTTFVASSWGQFFWLYSGDSVENIKKGCGTNILYGSNSDRIGNFWLGGIEAGLNYFDTKTRKVFNLRDGNGLTGSKVERAIILPDNNVLLSTNTGITVLRLKDSSIAVTNEEDFNRKYEIFGFSSTDGLSGEGFRNPYADSLGLLWLTNGRGEVQIIFPGEVRNFKPSNLTIESIQIEDADHEVNTEFRWIPGREFNPPDFLDLSYDHTLLLTVRSVLYKNFDNQTYVFRIDNNRWTEPQSSATFRIGNLQSGEHTLTFKAISDKGIESDPISIVVRVAAPIYESVLFWLGIVAGIMLIGYLIFRWRTHVVRERAKQLEQTVKDRTIEIELQKAEIEMSHNEIKGSIAYAKRIQDAILPPKKLIDSLLPENFILYKPKDIVAGDFYWFELCGDKIIFAAADCTGHGVPGAMVSVVCHNALNRAVREFELTKPDEILNKTRELVIETFAKSESEVKDGMDIALCTLDLKKMEIEFSGAHNPLWHLRDGVLTELKGEKQPIGIYPAAKPFGLQKISVRKRDHVYLITDGFGDQFGGDKGKKFKNKILKTLLSELSQKLIGEQYTSLEDVFEEWRGDLEQVDDVCIIGVRI